MGDKDGIYLKIETGYVLLQVKKNMSFNSLILELPTNSKIKHLLFWELDIIQKPNISNFNC